MEHDEPYDFFEDYELDDEIDDDDSDCMLD